MGSPDGFSVLILILESAHLMHRVCHGCTEEFGFSHTVPEPADTVPIWRRYGIPQVMGMVFYETRGTYSTRGYYSFKCIKKTTLKNKINKIHLIYSNALRTEHPVRCATEGEPQRRGYDCHRRRQLFTAVSEHDITVVVCWWLWRGGLTIAVTISSVSPSSPRCPFSLLPPPPSPPPLCGVGHECTRRAWGWQAEMWRAVPPSSLSHAGGGGGRRGGGAVDVEREQRGLREEG